MDRRGLLLLLATGTASAVAGVLADDAAAPASAPPGRAGEPVVRAQVALARPLPGEGALVPLPVVTPTPGPSPSTVPHPARPRARPEIVDSLPAKGSGHRRDVAITIDDGVSSPVVGAFLDFAEHSGVKLTFFPNGCYRSWTDHAPKLRTLLEAGQVQVGNHTWSHPDLTRLSDRAVADQINRNDGFLHHLLGVSPKPWFRPPYGRVDARVERIAADHGYPRITLWDGTFGDDIVLTPAQLVAQAAQWLQPGRIVVGHANHDPVTHCYRQLTDLIRHRRLTTRTLAEAFTT